jgi:hypothetical protein
VAREGRGGRGGECEGWERSARDQRNGKRLDAPLSPSNNATTTLKEARKNCICVF